MQPLLLWTKREAGWACSVDHLWAPLQGSRSPRLLPLPGIRSPHLAVPRAPASVV